jgi:hypothetical protein
MSWSAPRTFVALETLTAAIFNAHLRDNLRYLKGLDGTTVFDADVQIPGDGSEGLAGDTIQNNTKLRFKQINDLPNTNTTPLGHSNEPSGLWFIRKSTGSPSAAVFYSEAAGHTTSLIAGPAADWSNTAATASKTNVYITGGVLTIENRTGGTTDYEVMSWAGA